MSPVSLLIAACIFASWSLRSRISSTACNKSFRFNVSASVFAFSAFFGCDSVINASACCTLAYMFCNSVKVSLEAASFSTCTAPKFRSVFNAAFFSESKTRSVSFFIGKIMLFPPHPERSFPSFSWKSSRAQPPLPADLPDTRKFF